MTLMQSGMSEYDITTNLSLKNGFTYTRIAEFTSFDL
jgi:hypothetical protein